jgi:hypothetical protein
MLAYTWKALIGLYASDIAFTYRTADPEPAENTEYTASTTASR